MLGILSHNIHTLFAPIGGHIGGLCLFDSGHFIYIHCLHLSAAISGVSVCSILATLYTYIVMHLSVAISGVSVCSILATLYTYIVCTYRRPYRGSLSVRFWPLYIHTLFAPIGGHIGGLCLFDPGHFIYIHCLHLSAAISGVSVCSILATLYTYIVCTYRRPYRGSLSVRSWPLYIHTLFAPIGGHIGGLCLFDPGHFIYIHCLHLSAAISGVSVCSILATLYTYIVCTYRRPYRGSLSVRSWPLYNLSV